MTKKLALLLSVAALSTATVAAAAQAQQAAPGAGAQRGAGGPAAQGGRGADPNADPRTNSARGTADLKAPDAPRLPFRFVPGPTVPDRKFGNVSGVALTPGGNLVVYSRNNEIMMTEFDGSGKFLRAFNPAIAGNTHGLRIDRQGDIWITDVWMNVVWKLNPKGEPLMLLGNRGEVGPWDDTKWNGMFNQPLDVAFDADDNIYVSQSHGGTAGPPSCTYCSNPRQNRGTVSPGSDPRVLKFDKTGKFITSVSLDLPGKPYSMVHTVAVTPKGEVWVGNRQENIISVYDRDLKKLRDIQMPIRTSGLFVDSKGDIWMSSGMDGIIAKLDANGKIVGWFGNDPSQSAEAQAANPNRIGEAHYLTITPDRKTIYVADSTQAKVHRIETGY